MASRPDPTRHEQVLSAEHLKALNHNLAHLSMSAILDFYQRAYRDCRIVNSHTFPPRGRFRNWCKPGSN